MIRLRHRTNTIEELQTLDARFGGVEFDVVGESPRVCRPEKAIVNHNPGFIGVPLLRYLGFVPPHLVLAINVKEYGLAALLKEALCNVPNKYFIFDVPGPDLEEYSEARLTVFGRYSEYEAQFETDGYLIDSFTRSTQFQQTKILEADKHGQESAVISNTLRHGTDVFHSDARPDYLITKHPA